MVDYKIVKTCRMCNSQFTVHKKEWKKHYCDNCGIKFKENNNKEVKK